MTDTLPNPLNRLLPDTFLDPQPCAIDSTRVVKLQRRWPNNSQRDEVMRRQLKGTWERSWPKDATPIDPFAVERVVRALCRLRASAVRLRTPGEQLPAVEAEISLRVAPIAIKHISMENDVELTDTITQDRGWTLHHHNNTWLLASLGDSLIYTIDDDAAETLQASVSSNLLFPIAPSLVAAIEVGGDHPFRLESTSDGWKLLEKDKPKQPANDVLVRKLLRNLTELQAPAVTEVPSHGIAIALVTVDSERMAILVGPQGPAGLPVATAHGGRLLSDLTAWSLVDLRLETYRLAP